MCCAMTSPQHLVALPSPLFLLPSFLPSPHFSAGFRSLLSTAGGTVALPGEGEVCCCCCCCCCYEAFVSPSPVGSMCSSYILLFICSCNVVGWVPDRVVVAWFSVIDQRKSSQQNKEHVQTSRPTSPVGQRNTDSWLLGVTMTRLPAGLQHLCKKYRPGPGRPEYLLPSVLSFTFRRGQGLALSVCIDSFFNSLVCRMIRLSCSLKWLAIREYLWPRNEGDYRGGGEVEAENKEALFIFSEAAFVFFMAALCVCRMGLG